MESLQFIIELLGTFAFAISGIRSASSKNFDWFGGYVVGLATAIGGGTIRDVMLGQAPFWMTNSVYMVCTAFALLTFVMLKRQFTRLSKTWFLFDTLGLALFTIAGVRLTDSSLMVPIKSVSGVTGLGREVKKLEYTCGLCNYAKCYKRRKRERK